MVSEDGDVGLDFPSHSQRAQVYIETHIPHSLLVSFWKAFSLHLSPEGTFAGASQD